MTHVQGRRILAVLLAVLLMLGNGVTLIAEAAFNAEDSTANPVHDTRSDVTSVTYATYANPACPSPDSSYLVNPNGMCLMISVFDTTATNKTSLYTWKSGSSVVVNGNYGVALFVDATGILVKYIDYFGKEFSIESPDGKALPDGGNYPKAGMAIPDNGYLVYIPNGTTDELGRDLRKVVLGTLTPSQPDELVPNFVAGMLGQRITTVKIALAPQPVEQLQILTDEQISKGIHYQEKDIAFFNRTEQRQRVNQLMINLAEPNTKVISSKARDRVVAMESIPAQVNREMIRGNRVVAAINGDMFGTQTGLNVGLQVQDGKLLINHVNEASAPMQPTFFIDNHNIPSIDTLIMRGELTVNGQIAPIDSLNRNENVDNKLALYTPLHSLNGKITFSSTATYAATAAYAVIQTNADPTALRPGVATTGTVTLLADNVQNVAIPADSVIIAAFGAKADWLRANMPSGSEAAFTFNLLQGDNEQVNNTITTAVSSYSWLVKDGKPLTQAEMLSMGYSSSLITTANARTSIGITAEGRILAVTVDKGSTLFNGSDGMTLPDLAQYMVSQGAVTAINLDGGGSTEMLVRRSGSSTPTTINHPSDNSSRAVTNALLFLSQALPTAEVGSVIVDTPIKIYTGSTFQFGYRVMDINGNPFLPGAKKGTYSTTIGAIDQQGLYTAPSQSGKGKVRVAVDQAIGEAAVEVVDEVSALSFVQIGDIILKQGDVASYALKAADADGKPIILDPSQVQWTLDDSLGSVNSSGELTITATAGKGKLTATISGQTATAPIIVGLEEQIIDDFEAYDISGYHLGGYMFNQVNLYGSPNSTNPSFSTTIKRSGERSLKVDYDTTPWKRSLNGTINIIPHWYPAAGAAIGKWSNQLADQMLQSYKSEIRPKKFGLWVYGDGKAPWLRSIFKVNGQDKTIDIASKIDWIGWKYLEVKIPQEWALPITLNYLYSVETNKSIPDYKGTIYLDDLKFIYTDKVEDYSGPTFSSTTPAKDSIYKSTFDFTTRIKDDLSGVDKNSLRVLVNGEAYAYTYEEESGQLSLSFSNLAEGDYHVQVMVADKAGNEAKPGIDRTLRVDLTPDVEAPVVSDFMPSSSVTVRTPVPRITFRLTDVKSGIDPKTVAVQLDGTALAVDYDAKTGWGYAMPEAPIADGSHSLVLHAQDVAGNLLKTTQDFNLAAVAQPKNPNQFNISIVPDTQGNAFTQAMYQKIAKEDTELVLHVGDIVDTATDADYQDGYRLVQQYMTKPFFVIPGNHEVFLGDLHNFYELFGMATFHFEYGNTLIVGLNSAYGQSIAASDSTQFNYLERLLRNNTKRNVLVYNHVITKDDYGTLHEMSASEAAKFESILGNYKKQNPDVNVDVIFGHLHTLQQWKKDGVTYTIAGNAANKAYVSHDNGDILGSGIMKVTNEGMAYTYAPLVSEVYVRNPGLQEDRLNLVEGARSKLDLYGNFAVYPSNYMANISAFPLIGIKWTSNAPDIVSVDENGLIQAVGTGTAQITATSGGKSHTVTITTVSQSSVKPIHLELMVDGRMKTSSTQVPTVMATDALGNRYALNYELVQWTFKEKLIALNDRNELAAGTQVGTEEITASFAGLTTMTTVEVYRESSNGGGYTPSLPQAPLTPVKPAPTVEPIGNGVQVSVEIASKLDANGKQTATVSKELIQQALNSLKEQPASKKEQVRFTVTGAEGKTSPQTSFLLQTADLNLLLSSSVDAVAFETDNRMVTFDRKALSAIIANAAGEIVISVESKPNHPAADGGRPVVELTVMSNGQPVKAFEDGFVDVSLPYPAAVDEIQEAIVIYSVDDSGKQLVRNGRYNAKQGTVDFRTSHFSTYAIGYVPMRYTDVTTNYAHDAIAYLSARDILSGTGADRFMPNSMITRADFTLILAHIADVDLKAYGSTSAYADVPPNAYYAQAVAWASKLGIASGVGKNHYAPKKTISRAEMAVMITKFAKSMNISLPTATTDLTAFADTTSIPTYAADAARILQQAGILSGKTANGQTVRFAPHDLSMRQEAATLLAPLMQLMLTGTQE